MADRQTKVTLSLLSQQYEEGMRRSSKATRDFGTEAEKLGQQKQAFDLLGRAALTGGLAIGAGLTVAVAKAADFNQAMSFVQAATHETTENMGLLRQAALDAGASTVFSATESANAIEELSKAGVSTADILGGALAGSLDLAAAGGIGVARAAEVASTTLKQFNLEGSQATHVADLLAAGAGKAVGGVEDIAQALNQSGLVAAQFGLSVEETVGTLSAFAENSLLGSDAGTSFRTMLLRLANPTNEVKTLMKDLGIEAYDTSGQFIGIAGLAGELETALSDMTDEQKQSTLAMIFGQDAIRASAILLKEGEQGIRDWTAAVDDQGYAAETASIKLDNLKGDWEAFTGALDTALITTGDAATGPLRALVQGLTGLVDKFNELPEGAQQAVFWVAAVGGAGATALGSYLLLVPKIAEFKTSLDVLGPSAQRAGRAVGSLARVGAVGAVIGAVALGVDYLSEEIAKKLLPSAEEVDNKMRSAKSGVELFGAALQKEGITNTRQAGELLGRLGTQLDAVADSTFWNQASLSGTAVTAIKGIAEIAKADLPLAQAQFRKLADDAGLTDKQMRTLIKASPELRDALVKQASAAGLGSDTQTLLNIALGETATSTEDAVSQLEELQGVAIDTESEVNSLADAIRNFGSASFDTEEATIKFHDALAGLDDALADGAGSLDVTTEAGRNTLNAMLDVAQSTNDYAASVAAMGGSTEQVQGILEAGRQKIIDTRIALGDTEEQAKDYADQLIATPATVQTQVELNGVEAAKRAIQSFKDAFNSIPNYKGVTLGTIMGNPSMGGGAIPQFADGGRVYGVGGPRDDKVLARLSPEEHVFTPEDVRRMGGHHAVYGFRQSLYTGGGGSTASAPTGPATINVFDADGVLIGTMRGQVASSQAESNRQIRAGVRTV